jgi:type IV fimbrial biogenesis protein FimT
VLIMRRQRGINLIEVAVTVSVLGILIAAGMPSMGDWIRSTHVRTLAETTQTGLHRARQEAMKRNKVVTFWLVSPPTTTRPDDTCTLDATSGSWVVSLENPTGRCATEPSPTVTPRILETYGPGNSADGIAVAADTSSVSFNGFGQRTTGGAWKVDISHGATTSVRPLRVEVSASGGIRMCDPTVTAGDSTDPRACIQP